MYSNIILVSKPLLRHVAKLWWQLGALSEVAPCFVIGRMT